MTILENVNELYNSARAMRSTLAGDMPQEFAELNAAAEGLGEAAAFPLVFAVASLKTVIESGYQAYRSWTGQY